MSIVMAGPQSALLANLVPTALVQDSWLIETAPPFCEASLLPYIAFATDVGIPETLGTHPTAVM